MFLLLDAFTRHTVSTNLKLSESTVWEEMLHKRCLWPYPGSFTLGML